MTIRAKMLALLASVAGAICILATAQVVFLAIADISAGALRGVPETGWGLLISQFFFGPIAIVALAFFIVLGKKYKDATRKSVWLLGAASFVFALCVFGIFVVYDKRTQPPETPHDTKLAQSLIEAERKIDDLFYENKHTLPSESKIAHLLAQGTSYKIISENTYQLCGSFEKSTVTNDYKKYPKGSNSILTKKVVDGDVLDGAEAIGVFVLHGSGPQCYTISPTKPATR